MLEDYRTALVTGASRGIGEAFARQLAARSPDLVLVARSQDRLEALASEFSAAHGVAAQVVVADLAQPGAAAAVQVATERLGLEVDLLVNNAGFSSAGRFAELPLDVQADMVWLNVNTVMELTRLYLPAMRQPRLISPGHHQGVPPKP